MEQITEKSIVNKKEQFIALAFHEGYDYNGYDNGCKTTRTTAFVFESQKDLEEFILQNSFKSKYIKILAYIAHGVNYSTSVSLNLGDKNG